jgi:maltose alpha-D-glucosyltransferase/alpha-amylase
MLADMRRHIEQKTPEAIVLGEANVLPGENKDFFGEHGEGMRMMFNFYVNQHLFYALATGEVKPLEKALEQTQEIPRGAQWGQFLRNHDEVDLGRLSGRERQRVYDAFGPEKNMQLYDRGIRRRLAPMLHNDRRFLELAYSVLFALPSTPVMRYGDEIGMGDDLTLKERLSVRTPMQWSPARNAGFSSGSKTVRPVVGGEPFGYSHVNVQTEEADAHSLLHWTRKMVALRKACPEIGYGDWRTVSQGSSEVLVLHYSWHGHELTVIHNFSPEDREVELTVEEAGADTLQNLLDDRMVIAQRNGYSFHLESHGYMWLRGDGSSKQRDK